MDKPTVTTTEIFTERFQNSTMQTIHYGVLRQSELMDRRMYCTYPSKER